MQDVIVGRGARVTRLGVGTAPLGNLFTAVTDDQAAATVTAAWEAGVRYFDTAPHYGLGLSERRLGAALRQWPRGFYTVSTKVGRLLDPTEETGKDDEGFDVPRTHRRVWDFSRDGVRRSLESSLKRLGLDHVDIVLLHDPDDHWRQAVTEAYPALAELRSQGVVKAIGVGMNQWQMPARFVEETDLDVILLAGRHTLLDRSGTPLLDLCRTRGVPVIAAGVFNSGLLATHDATGTYDYAPPPEAVRTRVRHLTTLCDHHGVTLPQAALAYPLRHPAVVSVLVGVRSPEEIKANATLAATPVPESLWHDLQAQDFSLNDEKPRRR
ncbi:aldo/keto reductase [Sphaerisporangium rubeum]|uniref:D-threo-aldose 1-dehydrogenase n=1 Tax=Sphaerisporangium rubeum TaxID=321317 RepID=A0A7X0M8W4_9ACTN|nr:D-threo-aldose 1-dehydrogenase [Sphaerisporangium rubeum]